ncbi:MAG: hypothetical protein KF760_06030 [Candidatus Eremiobacteraeota bacterium]|nr:hypothetical protein [Candidatus Eremiobacteraeota bacterium]MCW5872076.1 hypothetical protein [Candidatus Eremiobacteraeota bacterium]
MALWVGIQNLGHRGSLALRYGVRWGSYHWYWRLGYALWLESWRGAAHRPGMAATPPPGWQAQDFIYGETPLGTAHQLLSWAGLQPGQHFCEIGCGRGVVGLVAHLVFGARVSGFEKVPALANKARWLARALQVEEAVSIREEGPYGPADLYFLTPTTWSAENWRRVCLEMAAAPAGARALVLSEPLPHWEVLETKKLPYSWGWSQTYLQIRS